MSEQWTIENDTGAELIVRAPNGFAVELDANSADPRERFAYFAIRQQARDLDQLRTDLAAAVSENAALLAANRDLKAHFDALKGDHDEAAHFGRHFIRDDPNITPRGAIIRLGDKCTDLFCRLQSAEQDRDTLRARLAAIYGAPAIARIESLPGPRGGAYLYIMGVESPPNVSSGTDLIARPAKD